MTENVEKLLEDLRSKEYRRVRKEPEGLVLKAAVTLEEQMENFRNVIEVDIPLLFDGDNFGFNRGIQSKLRKSNGNVAPNYARVITQGFDAVKAQIEECLEHECEEEKIRYGQAMKECVEICLKVAEEQRELAKQQGNDRLYQTLLNIPHKGAKTFYEACVFIKLCIYFLRSSCADHLGLGRFDQYMYPFYLSDKKNGVTDEEILEIIEEFFIAINRDTDLYTGIQQGDNGQSMVLGGFDKEGRSVYNELSQLCMQASLELSLIDPKINLRVGKNTPDEIYEYATLLTKQGLGFPQYCNDDIVVPGLVKLGYDYEDAINYGVAACWEYIIPGCGADFVNLATMDFPRVVNDTIMTWLPMCDTFEQLMEQVKKRIALECDSIVAMYKEKKMPPQPMLSIFFDGCIEKLMDIWAGGTKYHNYGCHGAGIANAADALAAVKLNIYEKKTVSKYDLFHAFDYDFVNHEEVHYYMRNSPKMGMNDDYVDEIAGEILDCFAGNLNNRDNGHGGIWRAGTGSAHHYRLKGENCGPTADGRKRGMPYSSSFSPSLDMKTNGILSVLQSFTKYDLTNIINGGPLTIEIHDTVLRNDMGIQKVAMLVKNYILLGGHQLQLNSINRERLLDAQKHPENYPNLIVRVWGWSGYFNELDVDYQNHIIKRAEYIG